MKTLKRQLVWMSGSEKGVDMMNFRKTIAVFAVISAVFAKVDFKAPEEPVIYDSTAGACAACGLLELAEILGEIEGKVYFEAALNMLKAMEKKFCNWDKEYDSILQFGSEAYSGCRHIPLIYGDYFFIEAISKLVPGNVLFW